MKTKITNAFLLCSLFSFLLFAPSLLAQGEEFSPDQLLEIQAEFSIHQNSFNNSKNFGFSFLSSSQNPDIDTAPAPECSLEYWEMAIEDAKKERSLSKDYKKLLEKKSSYYSESNPVYCDLLEKSAANFLLAKTGKLDAKTLIYCSLWSDKEVSLSVRHDLYDRANRVILAWGMSLTMLDPYGTDRDVIKRRMNYWNSYISTLQVQDESKYLKNETH
jgi:hypothetical protein